MEFPKGFRVVLLAAFCILVSVVAADLNEEKAIALKKMKDQMRYINQLIKCGNQAAEDGEWMIISSSATWNVLGFWQYEYAIIKIKRMAKSANMMAEFLGSSSNVFKCIDNHKGKASEDIEKNYIEAYKDPLKDTEYKAQRKLKKVIKDWEDDYSAVVYENSKLYSKSVRDIEKATNEQTIFSILKNYEKSTAEVAAVIKSINSRMRPVLVEANDAVEKFYNPHKEYLSKRIEKASEAIQNCFPKFFKHEIFLH